MSRMRAGTIAAVVAFALSRGMSIAEIEQATGITCRELMNPEARVPDEAMPQLWLSLAERFPGQPLTLEMARAAPFSFFGGLADGAQFADDLYAAIGLIIRNRRLIADRLDVELRTTPEEAVFTSYHPLDELDGGRCAEMGVALATRVLREFLGVADSIAGVRFSHPPHSAIEHYTAFFGVPVAFEAGETALLLKPEKLSMRIQHANAELFSYVETHFAGLQKHLAMHARDNDALAPLRKAIAQNALHGEFGAAAAAAAANMSLRSAQRLAAANGRSLQSLIEQVREDRAKEFLSDGNIDVNSISQLIGYSDDRAFRRAFQRWTGQSPSEYRDALKAIRKR